MTYEGRGQSHSNFLGARSMLRMAVYDPVSFAVMGLGILVTAILPFVF
jgi:hypothetical protein